VQPIHFRTDGRVLVERVLENTLFTLLVALNSVPKVALAPLFIIWMGTGLSSKVAISGSCRPRDSNCSSCTLRILSALQILLAQARALRFAARKSTIFIFRRASRQVPVSFR